MKNNQLSENYSQLASVQFIRKGQHRLFSISEQHSKHTLVTDKILKEDFPYRKIYLPVGDQVILFVKDAPVYERPTFEYSVLNIYRIEKEYDFDIVRRTDKGFIIENSEDIQLFIPLSYESLIENDRVIRLKVKEIDLPSNRVFFYSNPAASRPSIPALNELFEEGKTYTMQVTGFIQSDEGLNLLKAEYKGFKTTILALPIQTPDNYPKSIVCYVKELSENRVKLIQERFHVLKQLYKEGENYWFTIDSIGYEDEKKYYYLTDEYQLRHRVYDNPLLEDEISEDDVNTQKSFYLRKIDEKGYLKLYINTDRGNSKFFDVETLFAVAGHPGTADELFWSLEQELKDKIYQNAGYQNLYSDYRDNENIWLFSYLEFIQRYSFKLCLSGDYQASIGILKFYIDLEKWMLEGSDYLSIFGTTKREAIITKAETQIEKTEFRIKALEKLIDNTADAFILDIKNKIKRSKNLRTESLQLLKHLLIVSTETLLQNTETIIDIITELVRYDLLDQYDSRNFIDILDRKNRNEKHELNQTLAAKNFQIHADDYIAINNIFRIQLLQTILNQKFAYTAPVPANSAAILRYMSYLSSNKNEKQILLNKAIECITTNSYIPLSIDNLTNLTPTALCSLPMSGLKKLPADSETALLYENNGAVYQTKQGWAAVSQSQHYHFQGRKNLPLTSLTQLLNDKISIASPLNICSGKLTKLSSIEKYHQNWASYYAKVENRQASDAILANSKHPDPGTIVSIVAKNYMKDNESLLFVRIVDEGYAGEGILYIKEASKTILPGLSGILNPGDRFSAKVLSDENGRLSFTILDLVWANMQHTHAPGEETIAKVVHINNGEAHLFTDKGAFGFCTDQNLVEGHYYNFKIVDIQHDYKTFTLQKIAPSLKSFDEKLAFRKFLKANLFSSCNNEDSSQIQKQKSEFENACNELIYCTESILNLETDAFIRIELLYLLKLLASIIGNSKSYYYDARINYMKTIEQFKRIGTEELFPETEEVDDKTIQIYKSLASINQTYELLKFYNQPDEIDSLYQITNTQQELELKKLGQLLLSFNLLRSSLGGDIEILNKIKMLIYGLVATEKIEAQSELPEVPQLDLNQEPEPIEVTNLGKEGTLREFKTSFLYAAESSSLDIEKQSLIILKTIAGFLNAKGGKLFIGVKDNGDILGLRADYEYFGDKGNADYFERFIRKHIVEAFNKDVNSLIEFVFLHSAGKEYLEINIPEYDKAIPLNNDFYQRQGNETRILKGNDLILFFERKFNSNNKAQSNYQTKNYFDESIVAEPALSFNETGLHLPNRERHNHFIDQKRETSKGPQNEQATVEQVLAYLYFFPNGTYMLLKKDVPGRPFLYKITIKQSERRGFLLQGYDNGCINKVELRALLDKTFGRIYANGISREGNLVFLKIIETEKLICIRTIRNDSQFVKLMDTANISTHDLLILKGNNLVQTPFDTLLGYDLIDAGYRDDFERICYTSKQPIGKEYPHPSYEKEFILLESLLKSEEPSF